MQERQKYSNAPIVEASIDLRVGSGATFTPMQLAQFGDLIKHIYAVRSNIPSLASTAEYGEVPQDSSTHQGFRYTSEDNRQIVQVTSSSFTFTVLHPYDCWETFRDEAKRLWSVYRETCMPASVNRVGVRYIDRFNLPLSRTTLKEHLRVIPSVPPELPRGTLSSYFMQLQLPQDDLDSMLILNGGLVPPPPDTSKIVSVMLDFDLFCEPWKHGEEDIWNFLERLHIRNNELFEAAITDQTRELIK